MINANQYVQCKNQSTILTNSNQLSYEHLISPYIGTETATILTFIVEPISLPNHAQRRIPDLDKTELYLPDLYLKTSEAAMKLQFHNSFSRAVHVLIVHCWINNNIAEAETCQETSFLFRGDGKSRQFVLQKEIISTFEVTDA